MKNDLYKVAAGVLLPLLSVMGDFQDILREFQKNSFQCQKHL